MLTLTNIQNKLRELGLRENMYVEVHSSLSSFGPVEGGALTIIQAIQNIVTPRGAIIMTSFPLSSPMDLTDADRERGLALKIKILDPDTDQRTGMGIIPDTFRKLPDVRTGDGVFRVSAWGAESEQNSQGFSNLHARNGYALLLGVDIYRLTSMHYMEEHLPIEIKDLFKPPPEVQQFYPADQWLIEVWSPPEKPWYKIQAMAYQQGLIRDIFIGNAKCMFFKVNSVIHLYKQELIKDAFGLYGIQNPRLKKSIS